MNFLSTKRNTQVDIPDGEISKILIKSQTKNGHRITYLLQATDPADGARLSKFASKATFDAIPGEYEEREPKPKAPAEA